MYQSNLIDMIHQIVPLSCATRLCSCRHRVGLGAVLGRSRIFDNKRERTKRTLFPDPLPPSRKRTLKNVETNISFPSWARIVGWPYTQTKPII